MSTAPLIRSRPAPWTPAEQTAHWNALCASVGSRGETRPIPEEDTVPQRPEHPRRVRLYSGRNTHAARPINGGADHTTACGYYLAADSDNHWQPDTATVTCRECRIRTA